MKKIISFILFGLLGIGAMMVLPLTVYAEEEGTRTITSTSTHILGNAGMSIDTSSIQVKGTFGQTTLDQTSLTSVDPEVTIASHSICVSLKGIYTVTMNYQNVTYILKLFIKNPSETEYVLYDETFSYPDGVIPSSMQRFNNYGTSGGQASIRSEQLKMDPYTIVLFPSYLQGFTNYVIEADMKMTVAANAGRWTSIMYRYQTENYYQMAVRQGANAANGVEFAKRTSGVWNVAQTASFTEALSISKTYQMKVDIKDSTVKQYLNDSLMMTYESAFDYKYGRIGVQADNVTVYYDNVKVTLPETHVEIERYQFKQIPSIYHPSEAIIAPATTIVWFNDSSQMEQLTSQARPATVIFRLNSNLEVIDEDGVFYKSLYNTLIEIDGLLIPGFYVDDINTATALGERLNTYAIFDSFIFSKNEEVILAARDKHQLIRGVLMFDFNDKNQLSEDDLLDIRRQTNHAEAVAAVLPVHLVSKDQVEYLQKRLMTVWVQTTDEQISQYKAILSGAQGIITQEYLSLFAKYSKLPENTEIRRTFMIAHRGLYLGAQSSAPENTIEAALAALAKGADIIELDVHRTEDDEVVVMHDETTGRTAVNSQSLTIKTSTLAELKEVNLYDPIGGRENLKIPTLIEFFQALKGTGAVLFIEIKPNDSKLIELVYELIEDYDMYDQSVIITFGTQNIIDMRNVYPDIPSGLLTQSFINTNSIPTSIANTMTTVVPIKATLNTNYSSLNEDFMKQVIHRGITVWPWTIDDYFDLNTYYKIGVNGITSNKIAYFEETINKINVKDYLSQVSWENRLTVKIEAELIAQNKVVSTDIPEYVIVDDGGTGVVLDSQGQLVSIDHGGTVYMYITYDAELPDGTKIALVSDLIKIQVLAEDVEEIVNEEPSSLGLILGISGGVLALGIGAVLFVIIRKRRLIV